MNRNCGQVKNDKELQNEHINLQTDIFYYTHTYTFIY